MMLCMSGTAASFDAHIARFMRGVGKLHMVLPVDDAQLRAILHRCVTLAGLGNAYVEMIWTRGQSPAGSRDPSLCRNAFYAFTIPLVWIPDPQDRRTVSRCASVWSCAYRPPPSIPCKELSLARPDRGIFEAYEHGDGSAVLTDGKSHRRGSGVQHLCGGQRPARDAQQPSSGVLEGITHRTAIEIAGKAGCGRS